MPLQIDNSHNFTIYTMISDNQNINSYIAHTCALVLAVDPSQSHLGWYLLPSKPQVGLKFVISSGIKPFEVSISINGNPISGRYFPFEAGIPCLELVIQIGY